MHRFDRPHFITSKRKLHNGVVGLIVRIPLYFFWWFCPSPFCHRLELWLNFWLMYHIFQIGSPSRVSQWNSLFCCTAATLHIGLIFSTSNFTYQNIFHPITHSFPPTGVGPGQRVQALVWYETCAYPSSPECNQSSELHGPQSRPQSFTDSDSGMHVFFKIKDAKQIFPPNLYAHASQTAYAYATHS